ncbi:MAG: hypothetical protein ABI891_00590, partial [Acidobacteriota bacterium]
MNSEELEQSLRTEFEIYLKDVFAGMRQEMSQLQEKIEAEFEKHKSQLDEVFQEFSTRIETDKGIDDIFSETVVEHLRLARDEGARITATAIAEAEDMEKESAPKVGVSELNDAIGDIAEQTSQAAILKTLVNHAAHFTPRGAFFIIKNDHFVGWRVFGKESSTDEQTVREIFFPTSTSTILGEAVRSLSAVESSYGTYAGDSIYLNKLDFGQPDKMFAIPLVVRGRGVAVLYADYGTTGESVNLEVLEILVRIAGMTVELLAASQGAKPTRDSAQTQANYDRKQPEETSKNETQETSTAYQFNRQPVENEIAQTYQQSAKPFTIVENKDTSDFEKLPENDFQASYESDSFSYQPGVSENTQEDFAATGNYSYEENSDVQPIESTDSWNQPTETPKFDESSSWKQPEEMPADEQSYSWNQQTETSDNFTSDYSDNVEEVKDFSQTFESPVTEFESYQQPVSETKIDYSAPISSDYQPASDDYQKVSNDYQSAFDDHQIEEAKPTFETSSFEPTEEFSSAKEENYDSFKADEQEESSLNKPAETVSESAPAAPVKSRFSDRNVDLPIEVSEEERRLHNDARRFARLLVSEIKLYNEQKVREGRDESDLYERLREAIDRSREMYDKRVQPPV